MVNPSQLVANRLNAARSTGPRTPKSKAARAANAITHGVFARLPVLGGLGETESDWEAHRVGVVRSLAPVGTTEAALAEHVADLLWRMGRAARFDSACSAATLTLATAALPAPIDGISPADLQSLERHRQAADGARNAAVLLARLDDDRDDEPVDPVTAEAAWLVAVRQVNHLICFPYSAAATTRGKEQAWRSKTATGYARASRSQSTTEGGTTG